MCAMDSHNVQRVLSNVLPVVICYNMQESKYVIICCKIGSGKGLNVEASSPANSYERRYYVRVRGLAMALAWQLHVFAALVLDQLLVVIPGGVRVVKVQVVTQTCSS